MQENLSAEHGFNKEETFVFSSLTKSGADWNNTFLLQHVHPVSRVSYLISLIRSFAETVWERWEQECSFPKGGRGWSWSKCFAFKGNSVCSSYRLSIVDGTGFPTTTCINPCSHQQGNLEILTTSWKCFHQDTWKQSSWDQFFWLAARMYWNQNKPD